MAAEWSEMHNEDHPVPAPSGFAVLILEDDVVCAAIVSQAVKRMGGTGIICPTLASARSTLQERNIDFYILDQLLPDGTGSSFYYELRHQGRMEAAIMLTGAPDIPMAVELTRHGLFDYLTKPICVKDLDDRLLRAKLLFNQMSSDWHLEQLVTQSAVMKKVRRLILQAAQNPNAAVLLTGETGAGKDLAARIIHEMTWRNIHPMPKIIALNCTTLPAEIFEAELFGVEKGAYTGAYQQRNGLVETAMGGTLFLNEIAEVPIPLQAKLLDFLESHSYRRLGGTASRQFSGRIMAATNKVLSEEVQQGRFRSDLLYRLDVFTIHLPPLRERKEDLAGLAAVLMDQLTEKHRCPKVLLNPSDLKSLEAYDFPGNVRELRNILERSILKMPPQAVWLPLDLAGREKTEGHSPSLLPSRIPPNNRELRPIEAQEYALIREVLAENNGAIRRSAAQLGLTHQALLRRLERWPELRRIAREDS